MVDRRGKGKGTPLVAVVLAVAAVGAGVIIFALLPTGESERPVGGEEMGKAATIPPPAGGHKKPPVGQPSETAAVDLASGGLGKSAALARRMNGHAAQAPALREGQNAWADGL